MSVEQIILSASNRIATDLRPLSGEWIITQTQTRQLYRAVYHRVVLETAGGLRPDLLPTDLLEFVKIPCNILFPEIPGFDGLAVPAKVSAHKYKLVQRKKPFNQFSGLDRDDFELYNVDPHVTRRDKYGVERVPHLVSKGFPLVKDTKHKYARHLEKLESAINTEGIQALLPYTGDFGLNALNKYYEPTSISEQQALALTRIRLKRVFRIEMKRRRKPFLTAMKRAKKELETTGDLTGYEAALRKYTEAGPAIYREMLAAGWVEVVPLWCHGDMPVKVIQKIRELSERRPGNNAGTAFVEDELDSVSPIDDLDDRADRKKPRKPAPGPYGTKSDGMDGRTFVEIKKSKVISYSGEARKAKYSNLIKQCVPANQYQLHQFGVDDEVIQKESESRFDFLQRRKQARLDRKARLKKARSWLMNATKNRHVYYIAWELITQHKKHPVHSIVVAREILYENYKAPRFECLAEFVSTDVKLHAMSVTVKNPKNLERTSVPLDYDQLMASVDQLYVMERLTGADHRHKFASPWRPDKKPSCTISIKDGKAMFNDWAMDLHLTIIGVAKKMLNKKTHREIVDAIMGASGGHREYANDYVIKLETESQVKYFPIRCPWTPEGLAFWAMRGVDPTKAVIDNGEIYEMSGFQYRAGKFMPVTEDGVRKSVLISTINSVTESGFVYDRGGNIKMYRPQRTRDNGRFKSHHSNDDCWVYQKSHKMIVTKANKDFLVWQNLYPKVSLMNVIAERVIPSDAFLKEHLVGIKSLYIVFDDDNTGRSGAADFKAAVARVYPDIAVEIALWDKSKGTKDVDEHVVKYGQDAAREHFMWMISGKKAVPVTNPKAPINQPEPVSPTVSNEEPETEEDMLKEYYAQDAADRVARDNEEEAKRGATY